MPALIGDDGSFAYRIERTQDGNVFASGVIAHGPSAEYAAAQYGRLRRRWANQYRRRGATSNHYLPAPAVTSPERAPPQGGMLRR